MGAPTSVRDINIGKPTMENFAQHNDADWRAKQDESIAKLTETISQLSEAALELRRLRFIEAEGVGVEDAEDLDV